MKGITAIVKPTHECNLACRYCYVEDSAESGRMSSKTLERTIEQLVLLPERDRINIIWHGGEPWLMGIDFYEEAVKIQERLKGDKKFDNSIQTNATLIDTNVLDFCVANDFHIGMSLDGPEEIHNLTRVYPDGRGSFNDVWRGIKMIRERNDELRKGENQKNDGSLIRRNIGRRIGGGAITILTQLNTDRLDEIYDFFKANHISMKINPLIRSGRAKRDHHNLAIGPAEYGKALVKLFDRWFYEQEEGVDVDPLSTILGNLMTSNPVSCNFGESCREGFISIGPNGDVYPCGRFDGVREYWLGNIHKRRLQDVLISRRHRMMAKRNAENVKGCPNCNYKRICNAGCMHNAYMQKGDINDKDYYCASYQILFKHLEKALIPELERANEAYKQDMKGGKNENC